MSQLFIECLQWTINYTSALGKFAHMQGTQAHKLIVKDNMLKTLLGYTQAATGICHKSLSFQITNSFHSNINKVSFIIQEKQKKQKNKKHLEIVKGLC